LPLDPGSVAAVGSILGGAFVVVGDRTPILEMALNGVQSFRNESCGKCVPCRIGSQKLAGRIEELVFGRLPRQELELVNDLAETMAITSICGLGMVAANPVSSVLKHFPDAAAFGM
jgi:formate dehydrogenase beta subunit